MRSGKSPLKNNDMPGLIDIHCHLVYDIDDGAKTLDISRKMLKQAAEQGVRVIAATPHVRPGAKPFDMDSYCARLDKLRDLCKEMNCDITIISGAEILFTDDTVRLLRDKAIPTINQTDYVLVEWYPDVSFERFLQSVNMLHSAGYTTIVAHIERYRCLRYRAAKLEDMKRRFDLRFQVDNEAFLEKGSFFMKRFLKKLVKRNLIDYMASDAHNAGRRKISMLEINEYLEYVYGTELSERLTWKNQLELTDGRT